MVNQFPADWEIIQNPANADITMNLQTNGNPSVYMSGGTGSLDPFFPLDPSVTFLPANVDGDNPGLRPSGGGDPLSIWLPTQDIRIPKLARFPSVGALFSIRTGVFPDIAGQTQPYLQQQGVPFRALNMSPSTLSSQATSGGSSYPDWAMLDLFTVPFLPQKPYINGNAATPLRRLTSGGSTIGRMNINNPPVPYPFSLGGVNTDPPRRNSLDALFFGLAPSKSYDASGKPVYSTIDAAAATALSQAVAAYQQTEGPFFMAGQIANVPAVADYLYKFGAQTTGPSRVASISRNDLVRDTVGAITTRSNVYSIWVVAQAVKKKVSNSDYGNYEKGDAIISTVRRRYLVERSLEAGSDGVPGNLAAPSFVNTPNTYTLTRPSGDLVTPTSPVYQPALAYPLPYRWRIISVENTQM